MKGVPFHIQAKGAFELVEPEGKEGFWDGAVVAGVKRKKADSKERSEPRSVLDQRRSPSPPTSTSTLSSSLGGGGGGSSDTSGVAALSDAPAAERKWPNSPPHADDPAAAAARREEWATDLQPIPAALEPSGKPAALGVEDWETMLSESAPDAGQEHHFVRWVMGDIDDPSPALKQQLLSQGLPDFDAAVSTGFGLVDPGFAGFDPMPGISALPAISPPLASGPVTTVFSPVSSSKIPPAAPQTMPPSVEGNPAFPPPGSTLPLSPVMSSFQEAMEEKPQLFGPSLLQTHPTQNPAFFFAEPTHQLLLPPHPKRHHSMDPQPLPKIPYSDPGAPDLFFRRNNPQTHSALLQQPLPFHLQHQRSMKPKLAAGDEQQQQQQQALVDQLFRAAELVEAGNSVGARGILARLNHQLPSSPIGKPLLRSAFYFRDALHHLLSSSASSPIPPRSSTLSSPLDVVLKLSAYKFFSEVSPVLQFTNFTSIQALLEELGSSDRIHIIDFDIAVGGQWSSFMQELAQRRRGASSVVPLLKITAFVAPNSSYHPLELHLTRENLSHFAADLNIPFEFNVMSLESFDPVSILGVSQDEAIAVNLPIGSAFGPSIPIILRLVKQLSPKIVISVDQGCDRSDLSFSHHFLHSLKSSMVLLDSIDAAGANPEVANKIERYLLQPRIESAVLGRHRAAEKMLPWRTLFTSAGFVSLQFSNFTETQAECLLKRVQVRGFHVEKRLASLFLYWQRGELVSVSAWRC